MEILGGINASRFSKVELFREKAPANKPVIPKPKSFLLSKLQSLIQKDFKKHGTINVWVVYNSNIAETTVGLEEVMGKAKHLGGLFSDMVSF